MVGTRIKTLVYGKGRGALDHLLQGETTLREITVTEVSLSSRSSPTSVVGRWNLAYFSVILLVFQ